MNHLGIAENTKDILTGAGLLLATGIADGINYNVSAVGDSIRRYTLDNTIITSEGIQRKTRYCQEETMNRIKKRAIKHQDQR